MSQTLEDPEIWGKVEERKTIGLLYLPEHPVEEVKVSIHPKLNIL